MAAPSVVPDGSLNDARSADLRYVSDESPGIQRRRASNHFKYIDADGVVISDADTLARIKALAIPPAWTDVWICPSHDGHIQAIGRDARGRKQYRYHARWRAVRDEAKYEKMVSFARALPAIRKRVNADLAKPGLPREKVLAALISVMEQTLIRVGNEEYARQNDSFGLTTLRDHHARVRGSRVKFAFRGKSGIEHDVDLDDRRLARVIDQCQDLPGEELFQYVDDDGKTCDVGSSDVNDYLRTISHDDFTAKDFRTWAGTLLAVRALKTVEAVDPKAKRKRNVVRAIEAVALRLGNTIAVCKKCYVHPAIIDSYMQGTLLELLGRRTSRPARRAGLASEEAAVLSLLERILKSGSRGSPPGRARKTRIVRRSFPALHPPQRFAR